MTLTSFISARFGNWIVKLSHLREHDSFVLVAFHLYRYDVVVKSFCHEQHVVNFVNFLGENKNEIE